MGIELAMLSLKYLIDNQMEMSDSNWSIFDGQVWRSKVLIYIPSKSVYDCPLLYITKYVKNFFYKQKYFFPYSVICISLPKSLFIFFHHSVHSFWFVKAIYNKYINLLSHIFCSPVPSPPGGLTFVFDFNDIFLTLKNCITLVKISCFYLYLYPLKGLFNLKIRKIFQLCIFLVFYGLFCIFNPFKVLFLVHNVKNKSHFSIHNNCL